MLLMRANVPEMAFALCFSRGRRTIATTRDGGIIPVYIILI